MNGNQKLRLDINGGGRAYGAGSLRNTRRRRRPNRRAQNRVPMGRQPRLPRRRARNPGRRRISSRTGLSKSSVAYFDTLRDPCGLKGVKVPDIQGMPSSTFQMVSTGTLTTNSNGAAAIIVAPRSPTSAIGVATITAGTNDVVSWTTSSMTGVTPVTAAFGRIRPVSACLDLEFIGTTSADNGYIVGSKSPPSVTYGSATDVSTWETAMVNTAVLPIRRGMRVLWSPEDNTDFEYTLASGSDLNAGAVNAYSSVSPYIAASVTGAAASTAVARYTVTVNYEAIPIATQVNLFSAAPSPVDIEGSAKIIQAVSLLPSEKPMGAASGIGAVALSQIEDVAMSGKMPTTSSTNSIESKIVSAVHSATPYAEDALKLGLMFA